MRSSPVVLGNMRRLAEIGCRFALDDFGTGFSSLSYLWQFPISVLKIDKSFVQGIGVSLESETLTRAVIGLGRAMSKKVIAEGVETTAQAEFLRNAGCDSFQGFLYRSRCRSTTPPPICADPGCRRVAAAPPDRPDPRRA